MYFYYQFHEAFSESELTLIVQGFNNIMKTAESRLPHNTLRATTRYCRTNNQILLHQYMRCTVSRKSTVLALINFASGMQTMISKSALF